MKNTKKLTTKLTHLDYEGKNKTCWSGTIQTVRNNLRKLPCLSQGRGNFGGSTRADGFSLPSQPAHRRHTCSWSSIIYYTIMCYYIIIHYAILTILHDYALIDYNIPARRSNRCSWSSSSSRSGSPPADVVAITMRDHVTNHIMRKVILLYSRTMTCHVMSQCFMPCVCIYVCTLPVSVKKVSSGENTPLR